MFQSPDSGSLISQTTRRLLVVDDEPTLRLGFSYALSSKTTRVDAAATGRQALEITAAAEFDVIILDLRMPDIDGLGVIRSLRKVGILTPVVLCSAALNSSAALTAILHGVVDFLLKPIRPTELRGIVEFVLNPPDQPFAKAMKCARLGDFNEAIRLLAGEPWPDTRMISWMKVFRHLRDMDESTGLSLMEEKIQENLNELAYRVPSTP